MTTKEYVWNLMNELFDAENKTAEELVQDKTYCEFENDVEKFIREEFARVFGCDTSNGEPTYLGLSIWMDSKVSDRLINKLESKYKNKIQ